MIKKNIWFWNGFSWSKSHCMGHQSQLLLESEIVCVEVSTFKDKRRIWRGEKCQNPLSNFPCTKIFLMHLVFIYKINFKINLFKVMDFHNRSKKFPYPLSMSRQTPWSFGTKCPGLSYKLQFSYSEKEEGLISQSYTNI